MKVIYIDLSKKELADLAIAATGMLGLFNGVKQFVDDLGGPKKAKR